MTAGDKQRNQSDGEGRASDESTRDLPGSAPEDRQDHSRDDVSESKCPECGEPVHEKRMTCPNCGHEYSKDDYTTDPQPDEFSTEDTSFMEDDEGAADADERQGSSASVQRTGDNTSSSRDSAE